jgi:hypothetical protein
LLGAFARRDVALDADVALRFTEAAAHRENREFDGPFLSVLGATNDFAGIVARAVQFVINCAERFVAQVDRGSFSPQIVVGVTEESEMRAVLLQVKTLRIDDRDGFLGMRKDLSIEIAV